MLQIQINTTNLNTLATRIATTGTELGFTKNGKPMVASQGLRILASLAGFREEHSLVAAVKAETPAPQDNAAQAALSNLFNYMTSNYPEEQWDGETRELLDAAAGVLGTSIEWHISPNELVGTLGLDINDVKAWVAEHYHRIYEQDTPEKRCEWLRRYAELHNTWEPITAAQKQELRSKGYYVELSEFDKPFWENLGLDCASDDFSCEEAAWANAWAHEHAEKHAPAEKQACLGCGLPTQVDDDGLCNACAAKSDTMADAVAKLEARWGEEHAWYGRTEWREDVAQGNTKLGYWEWVQHSIEGNGGDEAHCTECGKPSDDGLAWDNGRCSECAPAQAEPTADDAFSEEATSLGVNLEDVKFWVTRHFKKVFDHATHEQRMDWLHLYREYNGLTPEGSVLISPADVLSSRTVADAAFEAYDFGDHFEVVDDNGWDWDGDSILTKAVFLSDLRTPDADSKRVYFRVELVDGKVAGTSVSN